MLRKILIISLFIFATFGFSASDYDKDITVLNQSRNDKVVAVFKEMMKAYEEEDLSGFFSYVSEDRFIQDYMTFYDAIDKDMRVYDILNIDTWVDKITEDGVKRYLYVTWEKRYQSTSSDTELYKKGYSRFLFDEINGKYKLIGLAGNNFWGGSLAEWREEMPEIPGQVRSQPSEDNEVADNNGDPGTSVLPDLIISNLVCTSSDCQVTIKNIGNADVNSVIVVKYEVYDPSSGTSSYDAECLTELSAGSEGTCLIYDQGYGLSGKVEVNPEHAMGIEESDYTNNCWEGNCP